MHKEVMRLAGGHTQVAEIRTLERGSKVTMCNYCTLAGCWPSKKTEKVRPGPGVPLLPCSPLLFVDSGWCHGGGGAPVDRMSPPPSPTQLAEARSPRQGEQVEGC
jgi:hypothetical protein